MKPLQGKRIAVLKRKWLEKVEEQSEKTLPAINKK